MIQKLSHRYTRPLAGFLMIAALFTSLPTQIFADTLSATLQANGQSNSLTLATSTDSFTVTLASAGATACQLTSPEASGIATSSSMTINPGHSWYPAVGGSTTFTVTCTDGVDNTTSTVVVSLPAGGNNGGNNGGGSGGASLSADIKANGSDGPTVTINNGDSWTYSWSSVSATACQLTAQAAGTTTPSGISTTGTSAGITAGHPWYPSTSTPTVLTLTCTDGVNNATDSVTIALGGNNGGGGSSSVTADIKVNGSDGPVVTVASSTAYTYSWASTNATACQLSVQTAGTTTPSGISTNGSGTIASSHPWYPTASSSVTYTFTCTDGVSNATDQVTVALANPSSVGVTVLINGSHAATINNGDSWTYTVSSTNATACQMTSPVASGVATSTSGTIPSGHPWYPAVGGTTTVSVTCTNGVDNATDSATVTVQQPGGGGGGGGGNGGGTIIGGGSSIPPVTTGAACLYVKDYMRADFNNDPMEVMKLQAFLKVFEGNESVSITGIYDQATVNAVNTFQLKYRGDILDPWALQGPTGYTYILTLKKVNELYCLHTFPLNEAQQQEIAAFRALVTGLRAQGINVELPASYGGTGTRTTTTTVEIPVTGSSTATSTTISIPIVGQATTTDKGQNTTGLAAVLFATPQNLMDSLQCIYEFLLILIVLYILGSVLEDVLYKKETADALKKRFYTKWTAIMIGLIIAMIVAYIVGEWCLILPLLLALIISAVWTTLYPKHGAIEAKAKTLYTSVTKETKNALGQKTETTIVTTEKK